MASVMLLHHHAVACWVKRESADKNCPVLWEKYAGIWKNLIDTDATAALMLLSFTGAPFNGGRKTFVQCITPDSLHMKQNTEAVAILQVLLFFGQRIKHYNASWWKEADTPQKAQKIIENYAGHLMNGLSSSISTSNFPSDTFNVISKLANEVPKAIVIKEALASFYYIKDAQSLEELMDLRGIRTSLEVLVPLFIWQKHFFFSNSFLDDYLEMGISQLLASPYAHANLIPIVTLYTGQNKEYNSSDWFTNRPSDDIAYDLKWIHSSGLWKRMQNAAISMGELLSIALRGADDNQALPVSHQVLYTPNQALSASNQASEKYPPKAEDHGDSSTTQQQAYRIAKTNFYRWLKMLMLALITDDNAGDARGKQQEERYGEKQEYICAPLMLPQRFASVGIGLTNLTIFTEYSDDGFSTLPDIYPNRIAMYANYPLLERASLPRNILASYVTKTKYSPSVLDAIQKIGAVYRQIRAERI